MTLEALTLIASLCGGQMPCNQRMLKCVEKQQMALAVHSEDPVLDPDEWSYTGSIAACVKRDRAPVSVPPSGRPCLDKKGYVTPGGCI